MCEGPTFFLGYFSNIPTSLFIKVVIKTKQSSGFFILESCSNIVYCSIILLSSFQVQLLNIFNFGFFEVPTCSFIL